MLMLIVIRCCFWGKGRGGSVITLSKRKGKGGGEGWKVQLHFQKEKGRGEGKGVKCNYTFKKKREGGRGKSAIALSTNETTEGAFFLPPP